MARTSYPQASWFGSHRSRRLPSIAVVGLAAGLLGSFVQASAAVASPSDPCAAPTNAVVCENSKAGTPESTWDLPNSGDPTIVGFATDMSVGAGSTESFKISSPASYEIDIYRLGWYQGNGARLITSLTPTLVSQPACTTDPATKLVDCGNWAVSASWAVPSSAVSGVYLARITRNDTGGANQIPFVVRNDSGTSDVLMQTSDSTWQAYNYYGNSNLYGGPTYDSDARAYKASYNRPFITRSWEVGRDYLFSNEYPMIRFLERNGYDVSYFTNVDAARHGSLIQNHRVYLTAGHDEYWSAEQRSNITAARDAGVSLAFFSGNDNYWKTRWEASIDGSSTSWRTMVCYKETWANAKIDPSSSWTGTWRDPRFTPPSDGGPPENALGGTQYQANNTDMPVQVSSLEGKMRIWRNTSLSSLAAGTTASLADHTVGYESNEDVDNGFRPAGLIHMSTSTDATNAYLNDFGSVSVAGTTTHHITLYKASSGALVFAAGTIQWAWGLDSSHDGTPTTPDPRMQQATVNLLADMHAQPLTLMPGLVAASASADTTAPTSTITSPATGTAVANGADVTVTGTATDAGGGVVGVVEVSPDGGSTWHPATGRSSWTYTFTAHGSAAVSIRSRATDDSGNIETPSAGITLDESCPCSLFGQATPKKADAGDTSAVELGVRFTPTVSGGVTGIRFYKAAGNTGTHVGTLWSAGGSILARGTFSNETASGWQTLTFADPVLVNAGTAYVASYSTPSGHYSADPWFFSYRGWAAGPLTGLRSIGSTPNGLYAAAGTFPSSSYQDANYYVDVTFTQNVVLTPTATSTTPRSGQAGVAVNSVVKATMSAPIQPGSAVMTVSSSGGSETGTTSYDADTQVVTFTPSGNLEPSTTYTVNLSGATSTTGNGEMAPVSWTFTTDSVSACPCSVFGDSTPSTADSGDNSPVELGLRFVPSAPAYITGVRFYKASTNTGTHTGTLWSNTGTVLAGGTFSGESASGWQTLTFTDPVTVTAGTTYVVSYHAPNGHYSAESSFFDADYTSGAITAPATQNGVYAYGATTAFPTSTYQAKNYWVDPLYSATAPAPTVVSRNPASGATGVSAGTTVSATFSTDVQAATITFTLRNSGGTAVPGSTSYNSGTRTATFAPSSVLDQGSTYTATVSGAQNTQGVAMPAPATWSFTTTEPVTCPCGLFPASATPTTVDSGDTSSVELGVTFVPSSAGYVTGVQFYKASTNTGTHTGTLWSSSGTLLATGTFTDESGSGWQTLTFAAPVAVTAGTTYVASYHAPNGHYSGANEYFADTYARDPLTAPGGGNGVYTYGTSTAFPTSSYQSTNYWVSPVFTPSTTAPTVTATSPVGGATGVAVYATIEATFSLPVQSSSIVMSVTASGGSVVPGTTSYDAATGTVTFTSSSQLDAATTYTATVSAATSTQGTAMAAPFSWTFGTVTSSCPCSLFSTQATPTNVDSGDTSPVELGVRFASTRNGTVTGVRFYKASANSGTHTGTLWAPDGSVLATGTFTNESASGWQTLTFGSPVPVTAGTTYTASYLAPAGHYSHDGAFFVSAYTSGPLTAPSSGGNGVFRYGSGGAMPTNSYNSTNYWVDVVFS